MNFISEMSNAAIKRARPRPGQDRFWIWRSGLYYLLGGLAPLRAYGELCASQWLERDRIEELQLRKLRLLLRHAADNVPGWPGTLQSPLAQRPSFPDTLADLAELPVLSKADLRARGEKSLARNIPRTAMRFSWTGGTTGEPLRVASTRPTLSKVEAAVLRGQDWAGIRWGERGVYLKGTGRVPLKGRLRQHLRCIRTVDGFCGSTDNWKDKVEKVRRFQPKYASAYPTALLQLAEAIGEGDLRVPVILSTGEMLYPAQRESLARTFGATVFDYYGSNEVSSLAYECEAGSKHVVEEHVILETVDKDGKPVWDQPGRILVTDLDNYAMPFIRYELGDVGVLTRKPCQCGRQLTVLASLEGRSQDMLCSRSGRRLPAIFFASFFRDLKGVRSFQLVQTDWDEVEVRFVPEKGSAWQEVEAIGKEIRGRLDSATRIKYKQMDVIELTSRGKSRLVVGLTGRDPAVSPSIGS